MFGDRAPVRSPSPGGSRVPWLDQLAPRRGKHESALSRRSRNRGPMSRRAASSRAAASVPGHVPAGVCPVKRLRRPSPPLRIGPRICDQGATAPTAPRPAIAAMRCVCLCALSSSAVTFPLLSPKSRVELQHIIATRATRPLFGRIADMRYRRRPSNHRGDRIACCETPRITGSRLRRPRRAASWAPVGLRRCLRRARLRAPRGGGRLCAAFRYAGAENALVRVRHSA